MTDLSFISRRSALITCNAAVSCDHPLASQVGVDILKNGGNAADAAVAMAAALNVTLPMSTGIGGDAFCLFYDSKSRKVHGINGSGRSPLALTLEKVKKDGFSKENPIPQNHGHAVTVPGAAAAWVDTIDKFGSGKVFELIDQTQYVKLGMSDILKPAIDLAESGFPVTEVAAYGWKKGEHLLKSAKNIHGHTMLIDGTALVQGQVFRNPNLANTFRELAKNGKKGFYEGRVAKAIAETVQQHGGVMSKEDLAAHVTTFDEQISTTYKGVRLWEIPPNGQGIVALMALNMLECFDIQALGHNSSAYLHTLGEVFRLCFMDASTYVADSSKVNVPIEQLLSKTRARERAKLIQKDRIIPDLQADNLTCSKDTTYFTAVDSQGNACSFINSIFQGFGTGIVPQDCGFTLQNRGCGFSLKDNHMNVLEPGKRPYHTIIPAMLTSADTGELLSSYGIMGGYMQPQGHVQVLLNMLEFGMDPQKALDQPRICIGGHGIYLKKEGLSTMQVEEGIHESVISDLTSLGYKVKYQTGHDRRQFGIGHVISNGAWWSKDQDFYHYNTTERVLWTGTDPRCDGIALGY